MTDLLALLALLALIVHATELTFFAWPFICMAFPGKKHPAVR